MLNNNLNSGEMFDITYEMYDSNNAPYENVRTSKLTNKT